MDYYVLEENISIGCGCAACQSNTTSYNNPEYATGNEALYLDAIVTGENGKDAVISGFNWDNDNTTLQLDYNFYTSLPSIYTNGGGQTIDGTAYNFNPESSNVTTGFQQMGAEQKSAVVEILNYIETVIDVQFNKISDSSTLTVDGLGFGQVERTGGEYDQNIVAHAFYPSTYFARGDVYLNTGFWGYDSDPNAGDLVYETLLHEIGHALGLQHTFSGTNTLNDAEDTNRYSVMSYDSIGINARTFMLYDIAALQELYGANTTYNAGNTTYTLQSGQLYSIWDAGGSDTLDASATSSANTIYLTDGDYSSVGSTQNIVIAYDAVIENAAGGSGGDTIYGNEVGNTILGNNGDDTIYGSAGDDTLNGGQGTDTVIYTYDLSNFFIQIIDSLTVSFNDLVNSLGLDTVSNFENYIFNGTSYSHDEILAQGQTLDPLKVKINWDGGNDITFYEANSQTYYTASELGNGVGDTNIVAVLRDISQTTVNVVDSNATLTKIQIFGQDTGETLRVIGTHDNLPSYIWGGDGDDTIRVTITGNDELYGEAGDDTIEAGNGDDTVYGGIGGDSIIGEGGNDTLYGGDGDDTIDGGYGDDTIYGDNVYGESGNTGDDILSGGNGDDLIYGNDGNDTLNGNGDNDRLYGGNGNDTLNGNSGSDQLFGQDGVDTLNGNNGNDYLYGGAGGDELNGDAGIDYLYGDAGNDTLNGGTETDYLYGGDGNDTINGDDGNDYLYGDLGYGGGSPVGDDILNGGAGADYLYGHGGADTLNGGADNDRLFGNEGNDELNGDGGNDRLYGQEGDDTLNGGLGNDKLYGQEDNDTLNGGDGDDTLNGDAGDDILNGDAGSDWLYGGIGNDTLDGGDDVDYLYGENGDDELSGGNGNDLLYGGSGTDTLNGNAGADRLFGGDNDDILNGDDGSDKLYGQSGNDTLNGGSGNDKLFGQAGNDTLRGDGADDTLEGGLGNDRLEGGDGSDWLYGQDDDDILIGGNGIDYLYGGNGSDTFGFTAFDGLPDQIRDFSYGVDEVNITDILSGYSHGVSDINDFVLLDVVNNNYANIRVDMDGGGDGFQNLAKVFGADFSGLNASDILANGTIIANETLL